MTGPVSDWADGSVQNMLIWAVNRLCATSEAAWVARLLLAHTLNCSLGDLFAHPERMVTAEQSQIFAGLVERRAQYEPVAYLTGHREFGHLDLYVDRRVLIPRPETELLVEQAIALAGRWPVPCLADVGAGSGAIAISLALRLPQAQVFALDISPEALQVARLNARRYHVEQRITWMYGDLLTPLHQPVHLIVANLPYIAASEFAALTPDIRLYEPYQALVSGADGLDAIRALLCAAGDHLTPDGVILLEIGAAQGAAVVQLAARAFPQAQVTLLQDDAHLDRMVRIERKERVCQSS